MPISAAPATSPSPSPTYSPATTTSDDATTASQTESKIDFSPPLIAMVIVIITAFLIITYSRLISKHIAGPVLNLLRHWRRSSHVSASSSTADLQSFHHSNSNLFDQTDHYQTFSPYGLDDSVIKTIPLSIYNNKNSRTNSQPGKKQSIVEVVIAKDCAVCLLEFEENDYVRTLPICSHAFHVDCIDIWLRSNANCPLCRAKILCSQIQSQTSPFVPLMAGRIRPSLDGILASIHLDPLNEIHSENNDSDHRIQQTPDQSSCSISDFDFDHRNRNLLLKRSYSFEYERTFQPSTTSPWRRSTTAAGFWSKRRLSVSSPFSALTKSRVFSFRSTRLTKSPFFARRGRGLVMFPFPETSSFSRRRSKSIASPASSRLRCGDPEALLSPERYNRR